jgi:CSLREA domain-containing protein
MNRYVAIATTYVALAVGIAHAATQVVTTTADPGSGTCGSTGCSLRDALSAAAPNDTVELTLTALYLGPQSANLIITSTATVSPQTIAVTASVVL